MPRLFFALWPDEEVRARLAVALESLPPGTGRPVPLCNLHITLAFLGDINEDQQRSLRAGAATIQAPAFDLVFSHLGCWPHAAVAWLAPENIPLALVELMAQLQSQCRDIGLKPDTRPYHPHLTIARKVRQVRDVNIAPIHWQICSFSLMESARGRTGSEYRALGHWPLISS